jgi:hypothetical protein
MGEEIGLAFIEETGRVDGWQKSWHRGSNSSNYPQQISSSSTLYLGKAPDISGESCTPDNNDAWNEFIYTKDLDIGDKSYICHSLVRLDSKASVQIPNFSISIIYRNISLHIRTFDIQSEELIISLARNLFDRIQKIPLSDEITYSPY